MTKISRAHAGFVLITIEIKLFKLQKLIFFVKILLSNFGVIFKNLENGLKSLPVWKDKEFYHSIDRQKSCGSTKWFKL